MTNEEMIKKFGFYIVERDGEEKLGISYRTPSDEEIAYIKEHKWEIINEMYCPEKISYTINSTMAYGIYNGYSEFDYAVKKIVKDFCDDVLLAMDVIKYAIGKLRKDDYVRKYECYKTDDYTCMIPYDIAKEDIENECRHGLIQYMGDEIKRRKAFLKYAWVVDSEEERKRRIKNYNNVMNEGREGFVPDFVTREAYDEMKSEIEKMEARLSDLTAGDEQ